jgi:hypothetical protein
MDILVRHQRVDPRPSDPEPRATSLTARSLTMTAVLTSRAFDIPAGRGPVVLYVVRNTALPQPSLALAQLSSMS